MYRNIRIGNQTSFAAYTPIEPFNFAIENGFRAFDWFPDKKAMGVGWEESDLDITTRNEIRQLAQQYDIELFVHAAWWLNPLKNNFYRRFTAVQTLAGDLGASLVNLHFWTDKGAEHYAEAIPPIAELLSCKNIGLSIENTPSTSPDDFNRLFDRLNSLSLLQHMTIGMCFDIGHANLYAANKNDYLAFMDALESEIPIIHVHAHENYGDKDSHLPLFTGPSASDQSGLLGFVDRLRQRDYQGSIILEQWPEPPSLLIMAHNRLAEMLEDTDKRM